MDREWPIIPAINEAGRMPVRIFHSKAIIFFSTNIVFFILSASKVVIFTFSTQWCGGGVGGIGGVGWEVNLRISLGEGWARQGGGIGVGGVPVGTGGGGIGPPWPGRWPGEGPGLPGRARSHQPCWISQLWTKIWLVSSIHVFTCWWLQLSAETAAQCQCQAQQPSRSLARLLLQTSDTTRRLVGQIFITEKTTVKWSDKWQFQYIFFHVFDMQLTKSPPICTPCPLK